MSATREPRRTFLTQAFLWCFYMILLVTSAIQASTTNKCSEVEMDFEQSTLDNLINSQIEIDKKVIELNLLQEAHGMNKADACFIQGSVSQLHELFQLVKFRHSSHNDYIKKLVDLFNSHIAECMALIHEDQFIEIPDNCKATHHFSPTDLLEKVKELLVKAQNFTKSNYTFSDNCEEYFAVCDINLAGAPHWESTSLVTPVRHFTASQKPQSDMSSTIHTSSMDITVKSSNNYHAMPTRSLGMPQTTNNSSAPLNGMTKEHTDSNTNLTYTEMGANYSNLNILENRIYTPNASTEPFHTSSTEPFHTSSTEHSHTSSTEPPHTTSTEPFHTSSTDHSHTSSTKPPHTSSTEPPHTTSTEPLHTISTEPSHTSSTEPPQTSSTAPPNLSAVPPGTNTERLDIITEPPQPTTELLHIDSDLLSKSSEPPYASTKDLYAGFDLLQSSTESPSVDAQHLKDSTDPSFSGTSQPHIIRSSPHSLTLLYSTELPSNKHDSSNYMMPASFDEQTVYANLVSPDTITDSASYVKSPFTIETDLKVSVAQTPDSELLLQSPTDIQFDITHRGAYDSLNDITRDMDSGIHSSISITTTKTWRSSLNTAKEIQTFVTLSSTGSGDFPLNKATMTVSSDEKIREIEDSDLGWAANSLGLSPKNTVSTKSDLPVTSPMQSIQPKDTSNKEGQLYHHVLQSEIDMSHERENGVAGPNYGSNMIPVIDTDQTYRKENSENAKDRGYLYSLISCIVGMLFCLSAMLYLLHKNRILRRRLQRTQHDPEVPEQRPLQKQQLGV